MMIMNHSHPTVQIPPWDFIDDDLTADIHSPFSGNTAGAGAGSPDSGVFDALTALQRYLPSNGRNDVDFDSNDAFSCDDHFRMYEFKVRLCARGRSHDWTECPYAHSGEKARRRDPRVYHYSGVSCPEFRKGHCKKGDACEHAHGVFECWLHPARYRTQPCKDGTHCRRRVCFFAHAPDQLRCVTSPGNSSYAESCDSFDGSPGRTRLGLGLGLGFDSLMRKAQGLSLYSPPSSPPSESPPISPCRNPNNGLLAESMRKMRIGNLRMGIMSPPSWGLQMGGGGTGLFSPRSPSTFRPGFMSLPTTPTRNPTRSGLTVFDHWEKTVEEEPVMERVESGKDIRARMYAKLSKENSFDSGTDVGWVSELLK